MCGHELVEQVKRGRGKINLFALLADFRRESLYQQQGIAPSMKVFNLLRSHLSSAKVTTIHFVIPPYGVASRSIGTGPGNRG